MLNLASLRFSDGAKLPRRHRFLIPVASLLILGFVWIREPATVGRVISFPESLRPHFFSETDRPELNQTSIPVTPPPPGFCDGFSDDHISVIVKTSAVEALQKLPAQLKSSLRCVRDPLFFSDLDQNLDGYRIQDVLIDFPVSLMANNPDFDLYREQRYLLSNDREKEIPALANRFIFASDSQVPDESAVLALDKYKSLHMVERAWVMQPGRDWYVFMNADTYLSFPNLHRWLAKYDPREKLYFGTNSSMSNSSETFFPPDSAGTVLSGAAMREFCVTHEGIAGRFAGRIKDWQSDQSILATALSEELELNMTDASANFSLDSGDQLPFGENDWCESAVMIEHAKPSDFEILDRAEKGREFSDLLFRDVFELTFTDGLPRVNMSDWNAADYVDYTLEVPSKNIKPPKEFGYIFDLWDPHEQQPACELACKQHPNCFQWTFALAEKTTLEDGVRVNETQCFLSGVFRRGEPKLPEFFHNETFMSEKHWSSGWFNERIDSFIESHRDCSADRPNAPRPDDYFNFHPTENHSTPHEPESKVDESVKEAENNDHGSDSAPAFDRPDEPAEHNNVTSDAAGKPSDDVNKSTDSDNQTPEPQVEENVGQNRGLNTSQTDTDSDDQQN